MILKLSQTSFWTSVTDFLFGPPSPISYRFLSTRSTCSNQNTTPSLSRVDGAHKPGCSSPDYVQFSDSAKNLLI
jgi:hypothetical protein